ncbi:hypothetical protein B0H14DRAFT_2605356 [Mycena olivaceomarginata]|nr:hypothetical protein B0H14DRAFT_2605356 [Mycena olivaceomarginata]
MPLWQGEGKHLCRQTKSSIWNLFTLSGLKKRPHLRSFWTEVERGWFAKWPVEPKLGLPIASTSIEESELSEADQKRIGDAEEVMRGVIHNRINNRGQKEKKAIATTPTLGRKVFDHKTRRERALQLPETSEGVVPAGGRPDGVTVAEETVPRRRRTNSRRTKCRYISTATSGDTTGPPSLNTDNLISFNNPGPGDSLNDMNDDSDSAPPLEDTSSDTDMSMIDPVLRGLSLPASEDAGNEEPCPLESLGTPPFELRSMSADLPSHKDLAPLTQGFRFGEGGERTTLTSSSPVGGRVPGRPYPLFRLAQQAVGSGTTNTSTSAPGPPAVPSRLPAAPASSPVAGRVPGQPYPLFHPLFRLAQHAAGSGTAGPPAMPLPPAMPTGPSRLPAAPASGEAPASSSPSARGTLAAPATPTGPSRPPAAPASASPSTQGALAAPAMPTGPSRPPAAPALSSLSSRGPPAAPATYTPRPGGLARSSSATVPAPSPLGFVHTPDSMTPPSERMAPLMNSIMGPPAVSSLTPSDFPQSRPMSNAPPMPKPPASRGRGGHMGGGDERVWGTERGAGYTLDELKLGCLKKSGTLALHGPRNNGIMESLHSAPHLLGTSDRYPHGPAALGARWIAPEPALLQGPSARERRAPVRVPVHVAHLGKENATGGDGGRAQNKTDNEGKGKRKTQAVDVEVDGRSKKNEREGHQGELGGHYTECLRKIPEGARAAASSGSVVAKIPAHGSCSTSALIFGVNNEVHDTGGNATAIDADRIHAATERKEDDVQPASSSIALRGFTRSDGSGRVEEWKQNSKSGVPAAVQGQVCLGGAEEQRPGSAATQRAGWEQGGKRGGKRGGTGREAGQLTKRPAGQTGARGTEVSATWSRGVAGQEQEEEAEGEEGGGGVMQS